MLKHPWPDELLPRLFGAAFSALMGLAASGCSDLGDTARSITGTLPSDSAHACPGAVDWLTATRSVGSEVTTTGPVAGASYHPDVNGAPTFLNIGRDYPHPARLTVVIFGDSRGRFPTPPEEAYGSGDICVTGVVRDYEGIAEIVVTGPDQIHSAG